MSKYPRILFLAALLVAVLALAVPALAQGGTISYGQSVEGEITADTYEIPYTFSGSTGDAVLISVTAPDSTSAPRLDTYLELRGPDGAVLYQDDDSGGNLNSLLGPYTLPQDGTYTIIATRFGRDTGGSTGSFTLRLDQATFGPLTLNETVSVDLSDENPYAFFAYNSMGSELLSLRGSSTGSNSTTGFAVTVKDTSGAIVNSAYSGSSEGSVLIDPLYLSQTGQYVFVLRREPATVGQGTVNVQMTLTGVQTQPIALDTPVTGTLDDSTPSVHYTFSGDPSMLLRLEGAVTSGSLQLEAQIVAPDGGTFNGANTAYGIGSPGSFVLDPLQLPQTGSYLLVLHRYDVNTGMSTSGGPVSYTVTLGASTTPVLADGMAVEGSVDQATYEVVYRYDGAAGQKIRITLSSTNDQYGPSMDVSGPALPDASQGAMGGGGTIYLFNLNGSYPGTASYEVTLPASGTYLFRVRNGFFGGYAGPGPLPTDTTAQGAIVGTFSLLLEVVE